MTVVFSKQERKLSARERQFSDISINGREIRSDRQHATATTIRPAALTKARS